MVDISIILTTNNREEECIFCLKKLLEQKRNNIEIILLNDWHIETGALKDYCAGAGIDYIHTGIQKKGEYLWRVPGFALNIGAKKALGDYLILGNAEIFHTDSNCISKMYEHKDKVATPRVLAQIYPNNFDTLRPYKNIIPFWWGLPKKVFLDIGGYDEDFIGVAFEDNDISDRLLSLLNFKEVDSTVIHLWNTPVGKYTHTEGWNYNEIIYNSKKGVLVRNENKNWGIL